MSDDFTEIAARLASIARGFQARGWALGTSGNLSAVIMADPLRLAISPSGLDKSELMAEQIQMIDDQARVISNHTPKRRMKVRCISESSKNGGKQHTEGFRLHPKLADIFERIRLYFSGSRDCSKRVVGIFVHHGLT